MASKKVNEKSLTQSPSQLNKREVTVLALSLLGGDKRAVDTEDIAVKTAELAPAAFSWRKYPDQINLELVRAVLSDAKKPQFGSLVTGTGSSGWRLSNAGVTWIRDQKFPEVLAVDGGLTPWAGSSDSRRSEREIQRIRTSTAWAQWQTAQRVERESANQMLRIDEYATPEMQELKLTRLRRVVAADKEIEAFLQKIAELLSSKTD